MTENSLNANSAVEVKKRWGQLSLQSMIYLIAVGGLITLLFWTEIRRIVVQWKDPSWSHGLLIPMFSLYFIHQRKQEILTTETKPAYAGLGLLVATLIFYFIDVNYFHYYYFQPLCMIATIGSVTLLLAGWKQFRILWLPIAFLFFAVPLPQRIYTDLTMPLRKLAAIAAAEFLSLMPDTIATVNGVTIDIIRNGQQLPGGLDVADACSGMRLLMAFVALGVAMAYLHDRPIIQRIVLLLSTIPIAILCNIVRVNITGFIYIFIDPKYASGFWHDMLGLVMLLPAFWLYGVIAWFMNNIFADENEKEEVVFVRKKD